MKREACIAETWAHYLSKQHIHNITIGGVKAVNIYLCANVPLPINHISAVKSKPPTLSLRNDWGQWIFFCWQCLCMHFSTQSQSHVHTLTLSLNRCQSPGVLCIVLFSFTCSQIAIWLATHPSTPQEAQPGTVYVLHVLQCLATYSQFLIEANKQMFLLILFYTFCAILYILSLCFFTEVFFCSSGIDFFPVSIRSEELPDHGCRAPPAT